MTVSPLVEVSGLGRVFPGPPEVTALHPCSLRIDRGEMVAVTGPSGSGKSTLLALLGLLDEPSTGSYLLDGVDVAGLSDRRRAAIRAHRLGFVFQAFHLLANRSVTDNVELGLAYQAVPRRRRRRLALEVVEQVGLGSRRQALCAHLSGGEQQRVAIARMLIRRPALILCDEPTGNLDSESGAKGARSDPSCRRHRRCDRGGHARRDGGGGRRSTAGDPRRERCRAGTGHIVSDRLHSRVAVGDTVLDALTSTMTHPVRTLLTGLGTLVGVGAFVATIGLAETAAAQVSARFDTLAATEVRLSDPRPGVDDPLPADVDRRLGRLPGVVAGGAIYQLGPGEGLDVRAGRFLTGSSTVPIPVVAATPGGIAATLPTFGLGDAYGDFHQQRGERVVVLGGDAAERLGVTSAGDRVIDIGGRPFSVIGVLDDVRRNPDLMLSAIVPTTTAMLEWGLPVTTIEVLIDVRPGAAALVGRQAPLALRPQEPDRLLATVPPDPKLLERAVESDVAGLYVALAGLALLIGALAITNATLLNVIERRPEIGVRRALGARRAHIVRLVVAEAALVGGVAGVCGTALAVIAVAAVAEARGWVVTIDPLVPLLAPMLGLVTGALAGVVPAMSAARTPPTVVLRSTT